MTNHEIADHFELLSKLMDIHGDDSFRAKSYASAAFRIEKVPEVLSELSVDQLKALPAIGASLAKKIEELNLSGKLGALEDYLENTPKGVVDMLSIKGIGPKKIALLWQELGIESIGELEYACQENRLVTLKGFGAKTQSSILESINYINANKGKFLLATVKDFAEKLESDLIDFFTDYKVALVGEIARQNNIITCIDFLGTLDKNQWKQYFEEKFEISIFDTDMGIAVNVEGFPEIRLHTCPIEIFGKIQFQMNASFDFTKAFYEKFDAPAEVSSEHDIFKFNSLAYIVPALRENAAVLQLALDNNLPELIQTKDIKGIIHSHSTYSDGQHSLEQMAKAAKEKGYEYLVISDHSQAAFYANGLSPERIVQQHAEIEKLNQKLAPFKIFKSIEADILNDGRLDYDDSVLSRFDLVIASVHSNLKMTEEKAMQRLLTAIQHPATRILGHPTGRLLLSRAGYPVDHKTLIDACAAHHVVIEINAHPRRLDIDWTWIEYAISKNVMLSINPDAHSIDGMDLVRYGVVSAQKGGLTAAQNLSSFSLAQMEAFVKDRKF